ncbi:hypothetical protein DUNSADRAFT_4358 [Dunaliella salina]|uniref:Encoded protein n=1 Tax=Dunaliella salina TaxID=3046 RepID=A0ABQ7H7R7_DUNSA|nr:hypothetical protein DUNSADRAFT_4358 [Dunaliella salina]|eukprot:KAF5842899.1 hypothetical protein DUNSADRAFT_4358 [Dunaliella salina]
MVQDGDLVVKTRVHATAIWARVPKLIINSARESEEPASGTSHVSAHLGSSAHHALASGSWTTKYSASNNAKVSMSSPQGPHFASGGRDSPHHTSTPAHASGFQPFSQPPSEALPLVPHSPIKPKSMEAPRPTEPLTAQALVDGLLQYVYKVTEPLRLHSAASNAAARAGAANAVLAPLPALPVGCPSLPSQAPKPSLPGKLDHATLVAYMVGNHE